MRSLVASLVVGVVIAACGSHQAEGPLAAPTSTPTPTATATPGGPSGSPTPGTVRVKDDLGGWSIDVPTEWHEQAAPQHGFEIRSYDPKGMDFSGNMPPTDQILVRMQMQQNPKGVDALRYATTTPFGQMTTSVPGREIRAHDQISIAGQTAERFTLFESQPAQWSTLEPTVYLYVHSPFFADRMLVIHQIPGASPLRARADQVLGSLQFYRPMSPELTARMTRSEIIAQTRDQMNGATIDRIEAKLMQYKEYEAANPSSFNFAVDPDMAIWVLAYSGTGIQGRQGTCAWGGGITPARPNESQFGGGVCGNQGTWWPAFDNLPDHTGQPGWGG